MPSLFDPQAPQALSDRLDRLTADSPPLWGRMNVGQMVVHCTGQLRLATGELKPAPFKSPVSRFPLKQLALYVLPTPKGVPTIPEIRDPVSKDFVKERGELKAYLARVAGIDRNKPWPRHPAFGELSSAQWGMLIWKHMDHHLKQFGA